MKKAIMYLFIAMAVAAMICLIGGTIAYFVGSSWIPWFQTGGIMMIGCSVPVLVYELWS